MDGILQVDAKGKSKDAVSKMKDIKRCRRCILPESLPSVKLDENGVCNHCKTYDRLFGNWANVKSQREKEFAELVHRVQRVKGDYDCLIPLSGGKDSTYALYLCNKIHNLKCLCVTFDNGFLSEHAKTNIQNALTATNADHMFYRINRNLLLELYKLFLVKCGNFCPVCMLGIALSTRMALKDFRIPLVVSGGGRRITYVGFIPEVFQGGDVHFFKKVVKGEPLERHLAPMLLAEYPGDMRSIIRLSLQLLRIRNPRGPYHIALYDYVDASYDKILNTLKEEMGWGKPAEQFEHIDCIVHEIPFYIHTLKFPELTTTTLYHSGLIRLGLMTREQAITVERNKLINPQVPEVLDEFLREIDMSKDKFESSVRDWRNVQKFRNKKRDAAISLYEKIARV